MVLQELTQKTSSLQMRSTEETNISNFEIIVISAQSVLFEIYYVSNIMSFICFFAYWVGLYFFTCPKEDGNERETNQVFYFIKEVIKRNLHLLQRLA